MDPGKRPAHTAAAAAEEPEQAQWVIDRGEHCFTILNTFPYAPGHVMVAPVRHLGDFEHLDDGEASELLVLGRRALAAQRRAMSPHGFNIGLNLGEVAGAGITDHLHLHVVPRWQGDNSFMPVIANTHVIPQALNAAKSALVEALQAGE